MFLATLGGGMPQGPVFPFITPLQLHCLRLRQAFITSAPSACLPDAAKLLQLPYQTFLRTEYKMGGALRWKKEGLPDTFSTATMHPAWGSRETQLGRKQPWRKICYCTKHKTLQLKQKLILRVREPA